MLLEVSTFHMSCLVSTAQPGEETKERTLLPKLCCIQCTGPYYHRDNARNMVINHFITVVHRWQIGGNDLCTNLDETRIKDVKIKWQTKNGKSSVYGALPVPACNISVSACLAITALGYQSKC